MSNPDTETVSSRSVAEIPRMTYVSQGLLSLSEAVHSIVCAAFCVHVQPDTAGAASVPAAIAAGVTFSVFHHENPPTLQQQINKHTTAASPESGKAQILLQNLWKISLCVLTESTVLQMYTHTHVWYTACIGQGDLCGLWNMYVLSDFHKASAAVEQGLLSNLDPQPHKEMVQHHLPRQLFLDQLWMSSAQPGFIPALCGIIS